MTAEEIVMFDVDGEELLPCPFCGGTAVIFLSGNGFTDPKNPEGTGELYSAQCVVCDAGSTGEYRSPREALKAWNTRYGG